ncbi:hypothetical protein BK026_05980 [Alteromonas sp. V450]|uniref:hypothetical protein n=1 Tax=Alteromonas sp. V450 TaxID=1912139 RepID=UPI0008FF6910|nr:hypothetical protein [Alteromonas sp. V450]OJF68372.1 hypothetical protein BK026_05980 [Alteromonas sp. V450]
MSSYSAAATSAALYQLEGVVPDSESQQAIQFYNRGERANKWDMPDYLIQMQFGQHQFNLATPLMVITAY